MNLGRRQFAARLATPQTRYVQDLVYRPWRPDKQVRAEQEEERLYQELRALGDDGYFRARGLLTDRFGSRAGPQQSVGHAVAAFRQL